MPEESITMDLLRRIIARTDRRLAALKEFRLTASLALLTLVFAGTPTVASQAADPQSPIGSWKTVDDKTGLPRAIVRIYMQDGRYFGRIERSFTPGAETRVCSVCTDERRNQPIIGLLILRNVTLRDGEYGGGDILDPDTGSVYRCKFHLDKDGTGLVVGG